MNLDDVLMKVTRIEHDLYDSTPTGIISQLVYFRTSISLLRFMISSVLVLQVCIITLLLSLLT